ncbi:MAG: stage III sporulation AC/AD family protein [Faecousia sp.]
MEDYFKICAGVILAVILGIALSKQNADVAMVLSILVCCMVLTAMAGFLEPVMDFLRELQQMAQLDDQLVGILLKAVGIGLVSEIAALICTDSGNGALGKGLQILASAVILCLCLPLMRSLLELMNVILGDL